MRDGRLQTYLLLVLFVAATVPALVVGAVQVAAVRRSYQQALEAQHARAVALSQEVSAYVDTHARAVRTLARQLETNEDPTRLDLQRILDTMRAEYPGIVGTFIGDAQGNALVFSPPTDLSGNPIAGRNYRAAAYFKPLMETRQLVYSDVIPGVVVNGNPLVTMVAPLLDEQGAVRYYISGGLDLSRLSGWLTEQQEHPDEIILLVDNRDTLIAMSGPNDYKPFANLGDMDHVQKMRSLVPWWESDTHLGAYATTGHPLNWGVAVLTLRGAFYSGLRSTVTNTALTVSLALLLGWAMAYLLGRTMNRPITALMRAATAVRSGDMTARVRSHPHLMPREFAELHASFNAMISDLQRHQTDLLRLNATLEERVEERTRQVTTRSRELAVLNATAASVTGALNLSDRLQEIARGIVQLVGSQVGTVVLRHPGGELSQEAVYAPSIRWQGPTSDELRNGLAGQIIAEGCPVLIADVFPHRHQLGRWATEYPHASLCSVPMRADGDIVGLLVAVNVHGAPFTDRTVELLSALAGQVGPAVSGAWLFAQVQEQWSTLRSITSSMHEGLLLVDAGHCVQFANPSAAALLNLDALPAPGTSLSEFFAHWSGGNPGAEFMPAADASSGAGVSFVDLDLPGPPRRTVAATAFPVMGEGLTRLGFGILLRDVTQERQLERSRDELIANVSHDLRTPLTTIMGNTATLLKLHGQLEPEDQAEFLEGIAQESRRLQGLIESVLDMSRIASGALRLEIHPEAWQPTIRRALKRAGQRWPGHRFEEDLPADLPLIAADTARLEQVLDNLLNNAAQYSPSGSEVRVHAREHQGYILTSVRDAGSGIRTEDLEHIFDRFFRGDSPEVRRVRGTGLGLPICRGIVEAHGGRIWAESDPGEGSTIIFTLPVATETDGGDAA